MPRGSGCVTCKAKRMKCDEGKPSCEQCSRRRVPCGGYRKNLRWRTYPASQVAVYHKRSDGSSKQKSIEGIRRPTITAPKHLQKSSNTQFQYQEYSSPGEEIEILNEDNLNIVACDDESFISNWAPGSFFQDDFQEPPDQILDSSRTMESYVSNSSNISLTAFSDPFSNLLSTNVGWLSSKNDESTLSQESQWSWLFDTMDFHETPNPASSISAFPTTGFDSASISESVSSKIDPNKDLLTLFRQPQFHSDSTEIIAVVFHQQTCNILSILEETRQNPWKAYIWPMAKDYPPLYDSIAAMTCFHMSKAQPRLRDRGLEHMQSSIHGLDMDNTMGNINLDTKLAATLALGFAKAWDHQISSTGMYYISRARTLTKEVLSSQLLSHSSHKDISQFRVLINICLYMDTIARFTSTDNDQEPTNPPLILDNGYPSPPFSGTSIDPLMGCASSLFPYIAEVADLVRRVRSRMATRNSPTLISQGTKLKKKIEDWTVPIEESLGSTISQEMTEYIQTAEAYRWATLLLLHQAVPELPSRISLWGLAEKVLVFLATVPLTSNTRIVQIFPLMVAGCEAIEEEDRDWVEERWKLMARHMITGIVDRCLQISSEVWKRRDEYVAMHGYCPVFGKIVSVQGSSSATGSSDFPMSAAFSRGVDTLTRSGCVEYTVKGGLHWLGVMKDWGWEGEKICFFSHS
ncbi:hypothetical protein CC78DRAFT_515787 [Lojkania enalia]|uniref:Zn(2)-C6 fungal-type domain-containing protein n=1 Tax=Lojkania enalia TaxID=147567 RepID=A0A9P4KCI7_9PLEO|nr:hypothetical protein CC78DRAFT_515787 [Didymosphaeria enalia]